MQGAEKQLTLLINSRRIDAFINQYERTNQSAKTAQIKAEYEKWKAKIRQVDALLKEEINTKKWVTHSTSQVVTSLNRSPNKFQIKCKISLGQGYENLHRLVTNPNHIQQLLPFCQQMSELKAYGDLQKDVLLKFKVPIISERSMAAHLLLFDRLQQKGTMVIFGEEIQSEQVSKLIPKDNLIKVKVFVCQVQVGVKEYAISTYASLDVPLSLIPDFVVKKILHIGNALLISNISKAIKKVPVPVSQSKLQQRIGMRYMGRL